MGRPKGSKNKPGHKAGGKRKWAGRPASEEKWDEFWVPVWLGRWLKTPGIIDKLRDERVRLMIEEIEDG